MSIVEVAKAAGVTHGTVSRVINGRGGVSLATAERIRAAMVRLGYRPKPQGQRRGRTPRPVGLRVGTVCLLLVGAPRGLLGRPGISTLAGTVENELRRRGLAMLLAQADSLQEPPPCITQGKADGMLLIGESSAPIPDIYRHVPAVWLLSSHTRPQRGADHVLPDNEQIGLLAAEYLVGCGHRRVAFYNDQPEHPGFVARGAAFCAALRERGVECLVFVAEGRRGQAPFAGTNLRVLRTNGACPPFPAESIWGFGRGDAAAALVDQLVRSEPRPQAVFVPTDEQALRLYPLLARQAIVPGRDMQIVSCDNQDVWLGQLDPRPVSIDLSFDLMGARAVEQLLWRISHPGHPAGTRILIPPRLIDSP